MNLKSILSKSWVVIVYLALVAIYFCRTKIGLTSELMLDITKTAPVLFLSIATFVCSKSRLVSAALLFSAAGDLAGERGAFLAQIALFAIAHIAYIIYFANRSVVNRRSSIAIGIWALFLIFFGGWIVSHIDSLIIKVACSLYMLIIGTMTATTFTISSSYKFIYVIAGMLFIFSDSCIAWNKFVDHFSGAGLTIMSTYFAAQLLFAWLAIKSSNK